MKIKEAKVKNDTLYFCKKGVKYAKQDIQAHSEREKKTCTYCITYNRVQVSGCQLDDCVFKKTYFF